MSKLEGRFLNEIDKMDETELSHLYVLLYAANLSNDNRRVAMGYVWEKLTDKRSQTNGKHSRT